MARCHRIGQTQQVKVYRLLTRNTYETTMFDRASKKLALEHVVLGGDVASAGDVGPTGRPRNSDELQRLLRQGAYGVLMDKGANGDEDEAARVFMDSNIEELLARNTRVLEVSENGVGFGMAVAKSTFAPETADLDIDINAEDFWERVLPGFQSAEKLLQRLEEPHGPLQLLRRNAVPPDGMTVKQLTSARREYRKQKDAFVGNVEKLVEYLCEAKDSGELDAESRLVLGKSELNLTCKLLNTMVSMDDVFSDVSVAVAAAVRGRRRRRRRRCRRRHRCCWDCCCVVPLYPFYLSIRPSLFSHAVCPTLCSLELEFLLVPVQSDRKQADTWLTQLEGSKVRTCRLEKGMMIGDGRFDFDVESDSDDSVVDALLISEGDIFGHDAWRAAQERERELEVEREMEVLRERELAREMEASKAREKEKEREKEKQRREKEKEAERQKREKEKEAERERRAKEKELQREMRRADADALAAIRGALKSASMDDDDDSSSDSDSDSSGGGGVVKRLSSPTPTLKDALSTPAASSSKAKLGGGSSGKAKVSASGGAKAAGSSSKAKAASVSAKKAAKKAAKASRKRGDEFVVDKQSRRRSSGGGGGGGSGSKRQRVPGGLGGATSGTQDICALCLDGGLLVVCDGRCQRAFHLECLHMAELPKSSVWRCPDCESHKHICLLCGVVGTDCVASHEAWRGAAVKLCNSTKCGRYYHRE
jgi:hypothetical protein